MEELSEKTWDVVIIGGGMGGGAAAYRLSRAGLSVLLIERGHNDLDRFAENPGIRFSDDPAKRLTAGNWPEKLELTIDGRKSTVWPVIGCGVGGSTLLYGATLERLHRDDFDASIYSPDGTPMSWPFSYSDLQPFYLELERLLEVRGTRDPLDSASGYELLAPPPMSDCDADIFRAMERAGLEPYRLHVGIRYDAGCTECGGHYCRRRCKGDALSRLIVPAMASGNLTVLDKVAVQRLDADASRVTRVIATREGKEIAFRGRAVVLAAGSLHSPKLLLESRNSHWPTGIGNSNDLVGRNLMFHAFDFVAVWPTSRSLSRDGPTRTLATRKFYRHEGTRLGYIHSMGLHAGYGEILHFLHQQLEVSRYRAVPLLRQALRVPAWIASKLFNKAVVFSTLVEDYPSPRNRVCLSESSPSGIAVHYSIPDELRARTELKRSLIRQFLPDLRVMVINRDVLLNLGHPCGTCRAGNDPSSSVVDGDGKVHELDNLFVADGSVMPTSGGVNPSLTIGAIALRIADRIAGRFRLGTL